MSASIMVWIGVSLIWIGGFIMGFKCGMNTDYIKQKAKKNENR